MEHVTRRDFSLGLTIVCVGIAVALLGVVNPSPSIVPT
jgi:hypothetical protein